MVFFHSTGIIMKSEAPAESTLRFSDVFVERAIIGIFCVELIFLIKDMTFLNRDLVGKLPVEKIMLPITKIRSALNILPAFSF